MKKPTFRSAYVLLCATALATTLSAGAARADSFFWAVNQFTTVNKLNGDTGALVDAFAVPFLPGRAASIAVVGNTGYYTILDDANVYKVNMTTHAYGGIAFNTGNSNAMNGITVDSSNNLWFAHGNSAPLQKFDTAGTLLGTFSFPTAALSYRDGSVVFDGYIVANRGDQRGPYDKYAIPGGSIGALSYLTTPFINSTLFGSNGIAFNGVNYYTSDEQLHKVSKWDINGAFVSIANLDPGSRYENWTFASQDIVPPPVPEPASLALFGAGLAALGLVRRRKTA